MKIFCKGSANDWTKDQANCETHAHHAVDSGVLCWFGQDGIVSHQAVRVSDSSLK